VISSCASPSPSSRHVAWSCMLHKSMFSLCMALLLDAAGRSRCVSLPGSCALDLTCRKGAWWDVLHLPYLSQSLLHLPVLAALGGFAVDGIQGALQLR
jgi:hypothetical protein